MKIVNIYSQAFNHAEGRIIGTEDGLSALGGAIAKAIEEGKAVAGGQRGGGHVNPGGGLIGPGDALFASDGEGYEIQVECLPDDWEKMKDSVWYKDENLVMYLADECGKARHEGLDELFDQISGAEIFPDGRVNITVDSEFLKNIGQWPITIWRKGVKEKNEQLKAGTGEAPAAGKAEEG